MGPYSAQPETCVLFSSSQLPIRSPSYGDGYTLTMAEEHPFGDQLII